MSEEVNFEWPSFSTVLEDVAASRGVNRVLRPLDDLIEQARADDPDQLDSPQPMVIRSELTEPLSLPEPLEPLKLDTSRVRELLDTRASTEELELSALSTLADPVETELRDHADAEFEATDAVTEDLDTDTNVEQDAEYEFEPEPAAESLEFETEVESLEVELEADTELDELETEEDVFETLELETEADLEEEPDAGTDLLELTTEAEDLDTETDELDTETDELDTETEDLDTETDELDTEAEDLDTEAVADVEWPSLDGASDTDLPMWGEEIDEETSSKTDLWDDVSEDAEPVALDWGDTSEDAEPVALDWGDTTEDASPIFDSWEESPASSGEAIEPSETALVFDMSDEQIIQHEASAGTAAAEDVFVTEDPAADLLLPGLDVDDVLGNTTKDEPAPDVASEDNNVVNLFETPTPEWDMGFDSIEVANEIEGDLLDLSGDADVIPIPTTDNIDDGLLGDASGFEFTGFGTPVESATDDDPDGRNWRPLEENEPIVAADDDAPTSDPWAYMRPEEETNSGWWANRPRFLGGKGKHPSGEAAEQVPPPIAFPGLSYDNECPSCGEEGNLEKDDPLAREVHLHCESCKNKWHTQYDIDAQAS